MTQEDKELLLKDLCARLPYGVKLQTPNGIGHLGTIILTIFGHEIGVNIKATERENFSLEECKPYLRPISSMMEEEKKEYKDLLYCVKYAADIVSAVNMLTNWLNANHFDYRGLIKKGLALPAPEEMYKND